MIFKAIDNQFVEDSYIEGMNKLGNFWGINWITNTPNILIVENRNAINKIRGKKTPNWVIGWIGNNCIYILSYNKLGTESSSKLSRNEYKALIKHELCHLFFKKTSKGAKGPKWLEEGLSIYLSGQTKLSHWKKPAKFHTFIESNEGNKKAAYEEGGFVVELLVNKYGKGNIIELVKFLPKMKSKVKFRKKFKELYGYKLTYKNINKIYSTP